LHNRYQGDIGLFGIFFAHLVVLKRDEGVAIQPDVLHAYIDGDVIECMARSDNMLGDGFMFSMGEEPQRAPLFVSNLLDDASRAEKLLLEREDWGSIELYKIPKEEFDIFHFTGIGEIKIDGPSVWICVEGSIEIDAGQIERLTAGQVVFIRPGTVKPSAAGDHWVAFPGAVQRG
jgi:mannose-6-phosphate isomerase